MLTTTITKPDSGIQSKFKHLLWNDVATGTIYMIAQVCYTPPYIETKDEDRYPTTLFTFISLSGNRFRDPMTENKIKEEYIETRRFVPITEPLTVRYSCE